MFRALALRLGKWSTGKVLSLVFMRNLSKKPINRIQMLSSKRHYRPMRVRVVSQLLSKQVKAMAKMELRPNWSVVNTFIV